jgi:hypothetical protein
MIFSTEASDLYAWQKQPSASLFWAYQHAREVFWTVQNLSPFQEYLLPI